MILDAAPVLLLMSLGGETTCNSLHILTLKGIAGMTAALACGRAGHEVVLLEEGSEVCDSNRFWNLEMHTDWHKRSKRLELEFR